MAAGAVLRLGTSHRLITPRFGRRRRSPPRNRLAAGDAKLVEEDDELVAEIKAVIADLPTYGYLGVSGRWLKATQSRHLL